MNENFCILSRISLKFAPKGPINNNSALFQVMAWRPTGDKPLPGQGATPVQGAPGWLAPNPVRGMREPPSGSMQLQKLQFQSIIYGNPEHPNWHQSFPTHTWLFLTQCGIPAGFIKTMQVEEMQNYKKYINIL